MDLPSKWQYAADITLFVKNSEYTSNTIKYLFNLKINCEYRSWLILSIMQDLAGWYEVKQPEVTNQSSDEKMKWIKSDHHC